MSKLPKWEKDFEEFIGRPVSGESIKQFIRNLLKEKQNGEKNDQGSNEEQIR